MKTEKKPYLIKRECPEKLNNFFIEAVEKLDIKPYLIHNNRISKNKQDIIDKYEIHPSIKMMKENIKDENKFSFQDTTKEDLQLQNKKSWHKKGHGRKWHSYQDTAQDKWHCLKSP